LSRLVVGPWAQFWAQTISHASRCLAFLPFVLLAGCATPVRYTDKPLTRYDKTTEYRVDDRPGGFAVVVEYERFQFIPESSAVTTACRSMLTSLAHEIAEARGRKIQPINEQRIRLSMGRNGVTGITSCSATVPVDYAE
jgi:hypothetical protein